MVVSIRECCPLEWRDRHGKKRWGFSRAGQERESEGIIVAKGVKKVYDSGKVKVEALRGIDLTGPL